MSDLVEAYDGSQLRAGWLGAAFGLEPDCAAAFTGPCDVAFEHMIDAEDLKAGRRIVARDMLHFIVEHADGDLERMALRQRLFVAVLTESLRGLGATGLVRRGNDVYFVGRGPERKLNVSVATRSRSGTGLMHVGVNLDPEGAPVPAVGLVELGVEPGGFAGAVLAGYAAELGGVARARAKVRTAP